MLPLEIKWGFAIIVFIVAQAMAYHDLQGELTTTNGNDQHLLADSRAKQEKIQNLEQEVRDLKSSTPKTITRTIPAPEPEKKCWFYNAAIKSKAATMVQDEMQTFVICNKPIEAPYLVKVTFNTSFQYADADPIAAEARAMGQGRREGNTLIDKVEFPSLAAYSPVLVRSVGKGIYATDATIVSE